MFPHCVNNSTHSVRLQESCQRSSNSVRRDRVFARYTERCANERVPTLNPASFGKLVRIIFPNVQTRRLGVRGESKYHYVDLSLVPDDDDRNYHSIIDESTVGPSVRSRRNSTVAGNETVPIPEGPQPDQESSRRTIETADFPSPGTSFMPKDPEAEEEDNAPQLRKPMSPKLDCQHRNTPTIRIPHGGFAYNLVDALPNVRATLPASMPTYLAMPSLNSLSRTAEDSAIELPDIHPYLEGKEYDPSIARSLYHLYRSYCIDVITAFRKCKEKPFFNHHSAYNGKMTVPVSKLFNLECLAPWIQECDMRMYKHLVKFVAPLALQEVPDLVSNVLEHISTRLVNHLVMAFEEKCPVHVVVAKVVPAARFANVLKKLKTVNECALQMNRMLENSMSRTQMWLDLMVMVDPDRLLDESVPPPECYASIIGVLKHDMRTLVNPIEGDIVARAEDDPTSVYSKFLNDAPSEAGVLPLEVLDEPSGLLEKWISWLECLPSAFEGHHPQCMIEWHTKFWRSLMTQIGQGGAHSYQSWWFVEAFTTQLLSWMAEMQGMLMTQEEQRKIDALEQEKKERDAHLALSRPVSKRKRSVDEDDEPELRLQKKPSLSMRPTPILHPTTNSRPTSRPASIAPTGPVSNEVTLPPQPDDDDADMDAIRQGPIDLPSFTTGLTSPVKKPAPEAPRLPQHLNENEVDDSGIGLGLEVDTEAAGEARKFNKKDWFLSSDPIDGPVGVGMGVAA
jgi:regulatory factor X, other